MTATLALADRLARLERTVASLQQQQPGSEASQPNYLTITPDGTIGLIIPGGVTVPVSDTDPPADANAVTFTRPDGSEAGRMFLSESIGATGPEVIISSDQDPSQVVSHLASVVLRASDIGRVAAVVALASDGRSSFLQLLSAQQLQLAFGTVSPAWSGGQASNTPAVSHGLGRTPQAIMITPASAGPGGQVPAMEATNVNSSSFNAYGWINPAMTGSLPCYWIAIG